MSAYFKNPQSGTGKISMESLAEIQPVNPVFIKEHPFRDPRAASDRVTSPGQLNQQISRITFGAAEAALKDASQEKYTFSEKLTGRKELLQCGLQVISTGKGLFNGGYHGRHRNAPPAFIILVALGTEAGGTGKW